MSDIDLTAKSALQMQYFTLNPRGDDAYALASRRAMDAYASAIAGINMALATDLRVWADRERVGDAEPAPAPEPKPVRWKLEWCNGELSYTTPYGLRSYARGLMFRRWPGLRFGSFCAHPAPGVAWKTGTISTVYWHPGDASCAFSYAPTEYCDTPVDADEVEMLPVGGGK